MTLYRNKRNGELYEVLDESVNNATNNTPDDQQEMVLYRKVGEQQKRVREVSEFAIKFEKVKDPIE
jgi:hypothetical protein